MNAQYLRTMLAAVVLLAQPFPRGGSNGGTSPVSPSVMATQMSVVDAAGRGTLELLILWRGSPGWFPEGWRRRERRIRGRRAESDDSQRVDLAGRHHAHRPL